jgi:CRP/FNR family transcriptional regulator, cyclic AMP receptor protein
MLKRRSGASDPEPTAAGGSAEMTYLEISFAKVPIFSACAPDELLQLAGATTIRTAAPGDTVIREGEPDAREFFVILKGEAQVTRAAREVGTLGPGDFFGELALFDPAPRNATIVAATEVSLAVLSLHAFRAALANEAFRDSVLAGMARRLHLLDARY